MNWRSWTLAVTMVAAASIPGSAQELRHSSLAAAASSAAQASPAAPALSLEQCIAQALTTSPRAKAADAGVDLADARTGQARSSRYPSLSATMSATRLDEDPDFVFPASRMVVPASRIDVPPMVMTLPANAFGPGFPPANVPLPVPGSTIEIPTQVFPIPEQDVTVMDKTLVSGSLKAMYALYTGGLASARIAQARAGVDVAREERRQTAADLAFDVTRAYYGIVLAQKLRVVAADTYERMKVTLDLTESLYKTGSGRVKKTDYLRNRAMVDTIASMVTEFEAQERTARTALAMLIGYTGAAPLQIASDDFAPAAALPGVDALVKDALTASPQIGQVTAGLAASKAGVRAAQAGHLPKVALFAGLTRLGNSYDAGIVSARNKTNWSVGVGVEMPLFDGFRTSHEVGEARAAERRLSQLSAALRDAIALDVRRTAIAADKALAQQATASSAYAAATENRELHIRAYQDELVETKDVIEAQLVEAVLAGQFFKVQYDVVEARARLDMLLGRATAQVPALPSAKAAR